MKHNNCGANCTELSKMSSENGCECRIMNVPYHAYKFYKMLIGIGVEFRHSTRNASKISRKVGNGSVIMGTLCLNMVPSLCRNNEKLKKGQLILIFIMTIVMHNNKDNNVLAKLKIYLNEKIL